LPIWQRVLTRVPGCRNCLFNWNLHGTLVKSLMC
jgi:hypothetical protein